MNLTFSHLARTDRRDDASGGKLRLNENLRGLIVLAGASAALVAIAYGAMMALTSPGGWAAKVASSAVAGEPVVLTSFAETAGE